MDDARTWRVCARSPKADVFRSDLTKANWRISPTTGGPISACIVGTTQIGRQLQTRRGSIRLPRDSSSCLGACTMGTTRAGTARSNSCLSVRSKDQKNRSRRTRSGPASNVSENMGSPNGVHMLKVMNGDITEKGDVCVRRIQRSEALVSSGPRSVWVWLIKGVETRA